MPALTKTQINYFKERLDAVFHKVLHAMRDEVPLMLPEFNVKEERIKAIASGASEIDVEKALNSGLSDSPYLFDVFPDPPHVCEYLKRVKALEVMFNWGRLGTSPSGIWADAVREKKRLLLDDFVLGNIQAEDMPELLKNLESWRPVGYWPLVRMSAETE